MSLEEIGKLRDNQIAKLVRDAKAKHPNYERADLRTLIRVENSITNLNALKQLDRYLRKEFEIPKIEIPKYPYVTIDGKEPEQRRRHLGGLFYTEVDSSNK